MVEEARKVVFTGNSKGKEAGKPGKMPEFTLRAGRLKVTAWYNRSGDSVRPTFLFVKTYKDRSGQWHETSHFDLSDLGDLEYLVFKAKDRAVMDLKNGFVRADKLVEDAGSVE